MTESKTNSKKDMKRNESLQKNPHERVSKTSRKKGNKKKPHPKLVPMVVIKLKPVSKVNTVEKTQDGDPRSKPKANTVFCSRHPKRTPRTKRKENYRSYEKGEGVMPRKLKVILENLWTAGHSRLYRNHQWSLLPVFQ